MIRTGRGTLTSDSLVRRAAQGLLAAALSVMLLVGMVVAQESDPTTVAPAVSPSKELPAEQVEAVKADVPAVPEKPHAADVDPKKRKKIVAVLAAVSGVAVLGVGAIAATMVWARRLRRIARDPGPRQTTVGNDFWFLKPEKAKSAESSHAEEQPPQPPPSIESPE